MLKECRVLPLVVVWLHEQRRDVAAVHLPREFDARLRKERDDQVRRIDRLRAILAIRDRAMNPDGLPSLYLP